MIEFNTNLMVIDLNQIIMKITVIRFELEIKNIIMIMIMIMNLSKNKILRRIRKKITIMKIVKN